MGPLDSWWAGEEPPDFKRGCDPPSTTSVQPGSGGSQLAHFALQTRPRAEVASEGAAQSHSSGLASPPLPGHLSFHSASAWYSSTCLSNPPCWPSPFICKMKVCPVSPVLLGRFRGT